MGGGSGVNLGIVIGETEEYFREMARQFPGYNIHYPSLKRVRRSPYFGTLRTKLKISKRPSCPAAGAVCRSNSPRSLNT